MGGGTVSRAGCSACAVSAPLGHQLSGLALCPDGTAEAAWVAPATRCVHEIQVGVEAGEAGFQLSWWVCFCGGGDGLGVG